MTTPLNARILVDELEASLVDIAAVVARDAAQSAPDASRVGSGTPEPPD